MEKELIIVNQPTPVAHRHRYAGPVQKPRGRVRDLASGLMLTARGMASRICALVCVIALVFEGGRQACLLDEDFLTPRQSELRYFSYEVSCKGAIRWGSLRHLSLELLQPVQGLVTAFFAGESKEVVLL